MNQEGSSIISTSEDKNLKKKDKSKKHDDSQHTKHQFQIILQSNFHFIRHELDKV